MGRTLRAQPLQSRPSITVVIPCYNYGCYVGTAVKSVLGQPDVDVEAIVIDDASTDGSAEVVRELAAADPRVRAILHSRNLGHIATYNEGLEQATGDYVVLLSADDALTPASLARATALLEAHPSVGLVYGSTEVFADDPPPVTQEVRNWTVWSGNEWIEQRCRSAQNCIASPEVVVRTSVQHAVGGYDLNLPHTGDLEMWLRIAAVSGIGRVNGPPQAYRRIHPNSMMQSTYPYNSTADLEQRLSAFENVLIRAKAFVPNGDSLFAAARKALAASALERVRSAYDRGRSSEEPVEDYMAFAVRVWPGVNKTLRWRLLVRCAAVDDRVNHRCAAALLVARVAAGLRWRVWRWRLRWTGG
jgi:glycosyltransferase involved in cell wall biosynthesis